MPKAGILSIDPDWKQRRQVSEAEVLQGAERLRDRLSSVPWYAEKAAREKELTGDEMTYWRRLALSHVNSL